MTGQHLTAATQGCHGWTKSCSPVTEYPPPGPYILMKRESRSTQRRPNSTQCAYIWAGRLSARADVEQLSCKADEDASFGLAGVLPQLLAEKSKEAQEKVWVTRKDKVWLKSWRLSVNCSLQGAGSSPASEPSFEVL